MSRAQGWARAVATVVAVLIFDQASKLIADASLSRGESVNVFFGLDLTNTRNKGVAFGALGDAGSVVAVLIGLALVLLLAYFALNARPGLALASRRPAPRRRAGQPDRPRPRRGA